MFGDFQVPNARVRSWHETRIEVGWIRERCEVYELPQDVVDPHVRQKPDRIFALMQNHESTLRFDIRWPDGSFTHTLHRGSNDGRHDRLSGQGNLIDLQLPAIHFSHASHAS